MWDGNKCHRRFFRKLNLYLTKSVHNKNHKSDVGCCKFYTCACRLNVFVIHYCFYTN